MPVGSVGYTRGSPPVYPPGPGGYPPGGGVPRAPGPAPPGGPPDPPRGGPPGGVHFRRVFNNSPSRDSWDTPVFGPPRGAPPYPPLVYPPGGAPPGPPILQQWILIEGPKNPQKRLFSGSRQGGPKRAILGPPGPGPPRARAGPPGGPPGGAPRGPPGTPPGTPPGGPFWGSPGPPRNPPFWGHFGPDWRRHYTPGEGGVACEPTETRGGGMERSVPATGSSRGQTEGGSDLVGVISWRGTE